MKYKEAQQIAAQCWCEPTTSMIEMDTRLALVFAAKLKYWGRNDKKRSDTKSITV